MTKGGARAEDLSQGHKGAAAAMVYYSSGAVQGQFHPAKKTACPEEKDFITR